MSLLQRPWARAWDKDWDEDHVREVPARDIEMCGQRLYGDSAGALYWPSERILVVADLHLDRVGGDTPVVDWRFPRRTNTACLCGADHLHGPGLLAISTLAEDCFEI